MIKVCHGVIRLLLLSATDMFLCCETYNVCPNLIIALVDFIQLCTTVQKFDILKSVH